MLNADCGMRIADWMMDVGRWTLGHCRFDGLTHERESGTQDPLFVSTDSGQAH